MNEGFFLKQKKVHKSQLPAAVFGYLISNSVLFFTGPCVCVHVCV